MMKARKESFGKNQAIIEYRFGHEHREAFGDKIGINPYGYPDMGNGLYGDYLPYEDWF